MFLEHVIASFICLLNMCLHKYTASVSNRTVQMARKAGVALGDIGGSPQPSVPLDLLLSKSVASC